MTTTSTSTAAALAFLLVGSAAAQDRPREEELFGAPPAEEKGTSAPAAPAPAPAQDRPAKSDLFGTPAQAPRPSPDAEARVKERLGATDNPLQIGGLLYLRSTLAATEWGPPSSWSLAAPALLDVYLDARPNDRVRGFALVRTSYDPTVSEGWQPFRFRASAPVSFPAPENPRGALDQLWLRFDVGRTAFVTVGKQHVKWGVGRFWTPGDFLHPVRRDPLAPFDERTGVTMLRVHLPWEARGWNFYAVAVAERLVNRPAAASLGVAVPPDSPFAPPPPATVPNQAGALGCGARAELVLGGAELGLSGVAQRGMKPRLAADLTAGVWELDVKAEVAWKGSPDQPRARLLPGADPTDLTAYRRYTPGGRASAVLGLDWTRKYSDEDSVSVGVEYFFQEVGYDDAKIYPVLLFSGLFNSFYAGRHYGGAYLVLPQPGSWNLHTLVLSAIANLSDGSALARLDWTYTLLTHLTLEAFVAGHAGKKGGEFRLGFEVPGLVATPAPVVDLGLALKLAL